MLLTVLRWLGMLKRMMLPKLLKLLKLSMLCLLEAEARHAAQRPPAAGIHVEGAGAA